MNDMVWQTSGNETNSMYARVFVCMCKRWRLLHEQLHCTDKQGAIWNIFYCLIEFNVEFSIFFFFSLCSVYSVATNISYCHLTRIVFGVRTVAYYQTPNTWIFRYTNAPPFIDASRSDFWSMFVAFATA